MIKVKPSKLLSQTNKLYTIIHTYIPIRTHICIYIYLFIYFFIYLYESTALLLSVIQNLFNELKRPLSVNEYTV